MTILVTGANGFVGTNLRKHLEERGHRCLTLDVAKADYGWDELEKISWCELDGVVHLAGKAHDLKKVSSEQSYFDVNVGLTERVFKALCTGKAKAEKGTGERVTTFIYFSSSKAAADGNAYGRSKLAAERFLQSEQGKDPNVRTVILRPAMIHGPGNKGNLNLLWGLARRGLPWPLAAFENKRSFTSIGNICAVVESLLHHASPLLSTFSVADDEMLSTNRLIELIAEACGRKAKLWPLPKGFMTFVAKVGDVCRLPLNSERLGKLTEDSFVDNAALKQALGWDKMPIGSEEGMRITLQSFIQVG